MKEQTAAGSRLSKRRRDRSIPKGREESPIRAIIRLKTVFPEGWHLRADLIPRLETGNLENGNWKSEGRVVPLQPGARLCPPNTRLPKLSLYGFFLAAGFFTPAFTGFFSPPLRLISAKKSLALNG